MIRRTVGLVATRRRRAHRRRVDGLDFRPTLQVSDSLSEISAPGVDGATVRIRHDGRVGEQE